MTFMNNQSFSKVSVGRTSSKTLICSCEKDSFTISPHRPSSARNAQHRADAKIPVLGTALDGSSAAWRAAASPQVAGDVFQVDYTVYSSPGGFPQCRQKTASAYCGPPR